MPEKEISFDLTWGDLESEGGETSMPFETLREAKTYVKKNLYPGVLYRIVKETYQIVASGVVSL